MFKKKRLDRAKEKKQKETPDGSLPDHLSLTRQFTGSSPKVATTGTSPKVASTGTVWRYSSVLSEGVPLGTAGLRPAAEGEHSSPDPLRSQSETPSVPLQAGGEPPPTPSTPGVAGKHEYTAPTAAEFLEGLAATLAKAAKARAFKGYKLENKQTLASRYRRLDLQRALLRGEIAFPKKKGTPEK